MIHDRTGVVLDAKLYGPPSLVLPLSEVWMGAKLMVQLLQVGLVGALV